MVWSKGSISNWGPAWESHQETAGSSGASEAQHADQSPISAQLLQRNIWRRVGHRGESNTENIEAPLH